MANDKQVNVTTPVGRIVAGSLYKPNEKDFDGKQRVYKDGPKAGQPNPQFYVGIAFPKTQAHWANEPWGGPIWQVGHRDFPQAAQRPDFAWKIEDGDSQMPNRRGRKPCEQEGWAGNWIVKLTSSFAPQIYRENRNSPTGWELLTEPDLVKPGYYVQVQFSVAGNKQEKNPGVYLNPNMYCYRAPGEEISWGPSVEEAGFGAAPLPPGVSAVPPALSMPAAPGVPPVPQSQAYPPPPSGAVAPPPAPPAVMPPAPQIPVAPNPQFLQVPQAAAPGATTPAATYAQTAVPPPVPQPVPPAPPVTMTSPSKVMTAKAGNISYQSYIAANWTDAQLIAEGFMVIQ